MSGNLTITGSVTCNLCSFIGNVSPYSDHLGVSGDTPGYNQSYSRELRIIYGTFTGLHRCFTEDELFNKDEHKHLKIIIL